MDCSIKLRELPLDNIRAQSFDAELVLYSNNDINYNSNTIHIIIQADSFVSDTNGIMQSVGQKNKNPPQNTAMLQLQKVLNTKLSQLQKLNLESGISYNSFA